MKKGKKHSALPEDEVYAILRAADEIIAQGGRTLLAKILKGSKDKKLLELELDKNPSYGYFQHLTTEEVKNKVNQMVKNDYLDIEKDRRMPLIVFSAKGWVIERERRAAEFLDEWDAWLGQNITTVNMAYLKDRNRGMILLLLRKILLSEKKKYISYLKQWEKIDYRKVREAIQKIVHLLEKHESMDPLTFQQNKRKLADSLIVPVSRDKYPAFLVCQKCEQLFILDETNPAYYTKEGFRLPEECESCVSH